MAAIACDYFRRVDEYVLVARIDAPSSAIRNQPCCDLLGRHLCKALGMREPEGQRYLYIYTVQHVAREASGRPTHVYASGDPQLHPLHYRWRGTAVAVPSAVKPPETSRGRGIVGRTNIVLGRAVGARLH